LLQYLFLFKAHALTGTTQKYVDWFWIVVANFMWATQVAAIKMIGDRLGAVAIAFIPMILSVGMFLPLLWWENRKRGAAFHWHWADARHFLVAGIFGQFVIQFSYTLGAQRTLAANAAIITLSIPVLVAIMASLMLQEKFNVVRIASFVMALAGVLLTSLSDIHGANFGQRTYLTGNLLFLVACAASAFYNTYCNVAILGILELAFIVYGVAMLLFFYVLQRLDVTQATLGNYMLPFFIGLLAVFVLKESITPVMWIGGVIVLVSTLLVTVYENEILKWIRQRRGLENVQNTGR